MKVTSKSLKSLCKRSPVEVLFSFQGRNVLIPAGVRRWCYCDGEGCFIFGSFRYIVTCKCTQWRGLVVQLNQSRPLSCHNETLDLKFENKKPKTEQPTDINSLARSAGRRVSFSGFGGLINTTQTLAPAPGRHGDVWKL